MLTVRNSSGNSRILHANRSGKYQQPSTRSHEELGHSKGKDLESKSTSLKDSSQSTPPPPENQESVCKHHFERAAQECSMQNTKDVLLKCS